MRFISTFMFLLCLCMISSSIGLAKEMKYNHESITIEEVKKEVDFQVLIPVKIPSEWSLEIKTYEHNDRNMEIIRLHYMDSTDENLMLRIEERKVSENEIRQLEEEFSSRYKINVNGVEAYYQEWANSGRKLNGKRMSGGLLTWIQGETYLQMDSSFLSKDEMVEMARSVR
ncbi:DUF4367 domain-containing protein [Rossellomorea vietnamensis]|uniref:DUF4367 domain-containing protein n=1 Tax=Rossellomorea vietnamensis TaxID=218284 RepID=UPI000558B8EC|nr:DUF4367 domain-containing protein [Rossellomorea vietnamensis]